MSSLRERRKSPVVAVLCWRCEVVFTVIHCNIDVEVSIVVESRSVAVSAPRVVVSAPEVAVSATWDVSRCRVCHVLS